MVKLLDVDQRESKGPVRFELGVWCRGQDLNLRLGRSRYDRQPGG